MRSSNRLTARAVQALKADGRYADGGNLYLSIGNGGKGWTFLYRERATGRLREMGLGPLSAVTLQDARQRAAAARRMLHDGVDPLADKRAKRAVLAKARTFGDYCDEFLDSALPAYSNEKHKYQWRETLTTLAAPLRPLLVNDITTDDVRRVLEPIWLTRHETAKRLRGRIERVLSAAKAAGLRTGENPARWPDNLKHLLGEQKKGGGHMAALPYKEAPAFTAELRTRRSVSALALEFTILTAARTGETIGATWSEIDLAKKLWTVPAARMKMRKAHEVPLSNRAVEILQSLKRGKPTGYVFEGAAHGKPLSNMAMLEMLRGLRDGVTTHGFRSAFRDWCGDETSFPRDVAEFALAHKVSNEIEAAYRRGTALVKRRELMESWAGYLAGDSSNVVTLAGKRSA
jgi:integrase